MTFDERISALEARIAKLERANAVWDSRPEHRVIDTVSSYYGIPAKALYGRCRSHHVTWPRHVCFYFLTQYGITYSRVAKMFNKDHALINYSIPRVVSEININRKRRAEIDELRKLLNEPALSHS